MGNVINYPLKAEEYYQDKWKKQAIVLHHTAGGHQPFWTIDGWKRDAAGHVATAYVVGGLSTSDGDASYNGQCLQAYPPEFWAYHLGVRGRSDIEKITIGIEICNYGWVRQAPNGKFINYVNKIVPESQVYDLGHLWRGYQYFHRYTEEQLEVVYQLVKQLSAQFGIPVKQQWDVSSFEKKTIPPVNSFKGVWTHAQVRADKTDCHPQPELIQMLNSL